MKTVQNSKLDETTFNKGRLTALLAFIRGNPK